MSTFAEVEGRVLTLYGAGDYDAALALAREAARKWPDRVAYTAFWAACFLAKKGEVAAALGSLHDAMQTSEVWWSRELLVEDDDLAALRDETGFHALVEESERRGSSVRAKSRVEWEVIEPSPSDRDGLLVALHGRTGNAVDSREHWRAAADAGVRTVVLQSSQMVADGMHCWDDLDVAARDVGRAVDEVTAGDRPRDGVVLAGFSQGGGVATRMALAQDPISATGFIGVCPSFRRAGVTPEDIAVLIASGEPRVSSWIVMGQNDTHYLPGARRVVAELERAGYPFSWTENAGVGHEFPEGFDASLTWMLQGFFGPHG